MSNTPNGEHLRAFVERIERVNAERDELATDLKEIYGEVRTQGYDAKIVKKIVRRRAIDPDQRREEEEIMSLYLDAMGEK
jgi:uncharacterized protein (UPF0335 family)